MLQIIMNIENEEDRSFVEELYLRYEKHMYSIAFGILGQHQDAEDCVHDTVQIIIDCLDKFKDAEKKAKVKYLVGIACRNCALNTYKKKTEKQNAEFRLDVNEEEDENDVEYIEDELEKLDEVVVNEDNCRLIYESMKRLEFKYRDVMVLRGMGYGCDDISKILGVSCEVVRQRVKRAKYRIVKFAGEGLYV